MPLRKGTYCRERDGALHLYYSESTAWNSPIDGLHDFLKYRWDSGSLWYWEIVTAMDEIFELRNYLGGTHLKPGEYIEIKELP
jgi:hypothetical protein